MSLFNRNTVLDGSLRSHGLAFISTGIGFIDNSIDKVTEEVYQPFEDAFNDVTKEIKEETWDKGIGDFTHALYDFNIDFMTDVFTADVGGFIEDSGTFSEDSGIGTRDFGEKIATAAVAVGAAYAAGLLIAGAPAAATPGEALIEANVAAGGSAVPATELAAGEAIDAAAFNSFDLAASEATASTAAATGSTGSAVGTANAVGDVGNVGLIDTGGSVAGDAVANTTATAVPSATAPVTGADATTGGFWDSNLAPAALIMGGSAIAGIGTAREAAKERERQDALEAAKTYWGIRKDGGGSGVDYAGRLTAGAEGYNTNRVSVPRPSSLPSLGS